LTTTCHWYSVSKSSSAVGFHAGSVKFATVGSVGFASPFFQKKRSQASAPADRPHVRVTSTGIEGEAFSG
jgi:hypothetical protein